MHVRVVKMNAIYETSPTADRGQGHLTVARGENWRTRGTSDARGGAEGARRRRSPNVTSAAEINRFPTDGIFHCEASPETHVAPWPRARRTGGAPLRSGSRRAINFEAGDKLSAKVDPINH